MSDRKIVRFETDIKKINKKIQRKVEFCGKECLEKEYDLDVNDGMNLSLSLIYDVDKMNEYGKIIMRYSSIYLTGNIKKGEVEDQFDRKYKHRNILKNKKIDATRDFVKLCEDENNENEDEAYKFIFWALMILTVDKTDKEEHLSLICDFARMLHISDEEMEDIVYVIKCICNKADEEYDFKSESVPDIFAGFFPQSVSVGRIVF